MPKQVAGPIWIDTARKFLGSAEIVGPQHSPFIIGLWKSIGLGHKSEEIPWCMGFVMAMMQHSKYPYLKSGWARDGLKYGVKLNEPAYGCIVVFARGSGGHIGFVVGRDARDNLMVLGGNQSDKVSIAAFSRTRVIGYRWPGVYPFPERFNLPLLTSDGKLSTNEA